MLHDFTLATAKSSSEIQRFLEFCGPQAFAVECKFECHLDFVPSRAPFVMHHFFLHERGEEAGEPEHSSLSAQTKYTHGTWLQEALAKHKNASDNGYLALYIQHAHL